MYRVMIVDDEPPLIRSVRRVIEKYTTGFEVVAEAYNGSGALDLIPAARPDIIITDIKMPVMDGISLVKKLQEAYSDIFPIIISGYQDFEYAKAALKAGVIDYILKPLDPDVVIDLMSSLKHKLDALYYSKRSKIINRIISNLKVEEEEIIRYFGSSLFLLTLCRTAPLSSCSYALGSSENNIPLDLFSINVLKESCNADYIWIDYGKDTNEIVMLAAFSNTSAADPASLAQKIHSLLMETTTSNNVTTVFYPDIIEFKQISENLQLMYRALTQNLIIGKTQLINCCHCSYSIFSDYPIISSSIEAKLTLLFQNKSLKALKSELLKLFQTWEQESYPQIWVEKMLKQIIRIFEKYSPNISVPKSLNIEQQLDEIILLSKNLGGLLSCVWDIVEDLLGVPENKDSTSDLMDRIDSHIKTNLAAPLSLQNVSELFGVSQPYMSRIFRKYKEMSFNEYITNLRVSEAKRLISEHPEMLMKDIAEIVGYQDQHYFSKIFKSITGVRPTEYLK